MNIWGSALIAILGLLSSCQPAASYKEELDQADSYSIYLYDQTGETPLLVDSGQLKPELYQLVTAKHASTNCTPSALIRLYSGQELLSYSTVYLDGACYSMTLSKGNTQKTYRLNDDGINFITQNQYPAMKKFDWLEGTWRTTDTLPFIEQWFLVDDQKLEGKGLKIISNPEPAIKPLEKLELTYDNGDVTYIAHVKDENEDKPVAFKLEEDLTDDSFSFVNPEHDFPQRITYKKLDNDTIEVTVGEYSQNGRSFKMTLVRTQEDPEDMLPAKPES